jgi:hypothetical protein
MVEQNKDNQRKIRNTIELAAFPVAGAAGYKAAEMLIRRGSYKNIADTKTIEQAMGADGKPSFGPDGKPIMVTKPGLLDELQAQHKINKRRILEEGKQETSLSGKVGKLREYFAENKSFRQRVKALFQEELGFTSITKHWGGLHPNQQTDAVIFGATAAGILLGAILLVTQNQALSSALARREQEQSDRGRC